MRRTVWIVHSRSTCLNINTPVCNCVFLQYYTSKTKIIHLIWLSSDVHLQVLSCIPSGLPLYPKDECVQQNQRQIHTQASWIKTSHLNHETNMWLSTDKFTSVQQYTSFPTTCFLIILQIIQFVRNITINFITQTVKTRLILVVRLEKWMV